MVSNFTVCDVTKQVKKSFALGRIVGLKRNTPILLVFGELNFGKVCLLNVTLSLLCKTIKKIPFYPSSGNCFFLSLCWQLGEEDEEEDGDDLL